MAIPGLGAGELAPRRHHKVGVDGPDRVRGDGIRVQVVDVEEGDMPIYAFTGKPRAGKSYRGVVKVLEAAEQGREVVTDLPLTVGGWTQFENVRKVQAGHFRGMDAWECIRDPELVIMKGEQPIGPLVVIDEAGQLFASLGTTEMTRVMEVLSEHGHSYADVIFLVQHHSRLPIEVKNLVDEWVECVSYRKAGFRRCHWTSYSRWYGVRAAIDSGWMKFEKRIFDLYDSHALGAGAGGTKGEVIGVTSVARFWMRWPVLMVAGAAAALVWVLATGWERVATMVSGEVGQGAIGDGFGGESGFAAALAAPVANTSALAVGKNASVQAGAASGGARRLNRWVGVVGDGILVEWSDGRQEMLTSSGLAARGWSIAGRDGDWYLMDSTGRRVSQ